MMRQWFCVGILVAVGNLASAATFSWKANTTGDWFTANNWTNESGYPSDGDTVMITNVGSYVILTGTSAKLAELSLGGAATGQRTLTFTNWDTCLYATNLTVLTNGYVTCEGPFTNNAMSNRVNLACASRLVVERGGSINVNGKGYSGGAGSWAAGNGPGGGSGGGSHGGFGQATGNGAYLGSQKVYGSPTAPLYPGSGGLAGYTTGIKGGNGGGAVCITAIQAVVNGSISADGAIGDSGYGSGGSGGSIFITCSTITGTNGTITAKGGDYDTLNNVAGGGGGGRIAVIYDQTAQSNEPVPAILFSALSGNGNTTPTTMADIGTLYFPDNYFFSPTNLFNGQWMAPGFTNLSLDNWTVSNVWIRLPGAGFRLTVTNTLAVISTAGSADRRRHRLELTDAAVVSCGQALVNGGTLGLNCQLVYYGANMLTTNNAVMTGVTLECPGDLTLTNYGQINIASGLANPDVASAQYGGWVHVGGDIRIATNSWLCPAAHPTNGTVVMLSMRNLTIDRGGGINADSLGYAGGNAPGTTAENMAYGPGAPPYGGGLGYRSGAGYGGVGGSYSGYSGTNYGSSNAPVDPGSGARAGIYYVTVPPGGSGGGSVQIRAAKTVTIQGTISANGGNGSDAYGGGASGGGIYIICRTFVGDSNGVLRANGGAANGYAGTPYGGGGGGRIAVWRVFDNSPSVISNYVNGGSGAAGTYGTNGTIVVNWLPPAGTIVKMR